MNGVFKTRFSKWFLGIPVLFLALWYGYHQNLPADERLSSCFWKARSYPTPLGDAFVLNDERGSYVSGNTIFKQGIAVGEIIRVNNRLLANDIINVRNLETGVEGQYVGKGGTGC